VFVLYLLLTRRLRAAAVAVATFGVLAVAGWIAYPSGAASYWLDGLFANARRTAPGILLHKDNQSLVAAIGRAGGGDIVGAVLAGTVLLAGVVLAVWAHRRGEEGIAILTTAFTALVGSPVSWSHHWVWTVPLVIVLIDVARRTSGRMQIAAAGLPVMAALPFVAWPMQGWPGGPLAPRGVLSHPGLPSDAYLLMALALLGLAVGGLATTRRRPAAGWVRLVHPRHRAEPATTPEPRGAD
jgi:alpha-1,2-mannosyltransferase